jgi:hypothetical protein
MPDTSDALALACSLAPGDYANRIAELRRLFTESLLDRRRDPHSLRLVLASGAARDEATRDLLRREQECCPFFTFAVRTRGDTVIVEVSVPEGAEACLDDLERLATRAGADE